MIRWISVILYIVCFIAAFYALSGLDFAKILRKGQALKAQVLLLLSSMALGGLVAYFVLVLIGIN